MYTDSLLGVVHTGNPSTWEASLGYMFYNTHTHTKKGGGDFLSGSVFFPVTTPSALKF